jgi:putative transposase
MIDRSHELSVVRQCQILELPRSTAYYAAQPESLANLLRQEDIVAGRTRIRRLMAKMGIEALYRKANTSRKAVGSYIYPYL